MNSEKKLCPHCGSELGGKTININPKPKGVIGLSRDDLQTFYTCICGYRASEFKLSMDWAKKNYDKEMEERLFRDAHVDTEGLDG